jgi:hypothetical protein
MVAKIIDGSGFDRYAEPIVIPNSMNVESKSVFMKNLRRIGPISLLFTRLRRAESLPISFLLQKENNLGR